MSRNNDFAGQYSRIENTTSLKGEIISSGDFRVDGILEGSIKIKGKIVVGNMGSEMKLNYTMTGDQVNLTARLESSAKQLGIAIQVGENIYDKVKDRFIFRDLGKVIVVGRNQSLNVYELIANIDKVDAVLALTDDDKTNMLSCTRAKAAGCNVTISLVNDPSLASLLSPMGVDDKKQTYNINADTTAGALAKSLKSRRLMLMTDVVGVYDKNKNLISEIKSAEAEKLIYDETISEGMIPKIKTCIDAVSNGVRGVVIIDGRKPHSILFELFSDEGSGTLIRK